MPRIYFHGNCNRYRTLFDRANSLLQKTIFSTLFPPLSNSHRWDILLRCGNCAWLSRKWIVFHVAFATNETQHPLLQSGHSHCLVSVNVQQVLINVIGCNFFLPWRNSFSHLCFIKTSMSDAIVSNCPSAAICHIITKCNGILVGRFTLYCHITISMPYLLLLMSLANIMKQEVLHLE